MRITVLALILGSFFLLSGFSTNKEDGSVTLTRSEARTLVINLKAAEDNQKRMIFRIIKLQKDLRDMEKRKCA